MNQMRCPQLATLIIRMRLNKNVFNLDFKTLRDDKLRTVARNAFQTVGAAQNLRVSVCVSWWDTA